MVVAIWPAGQKSNGRNCYNTVETILQFWKVFFRKTSKNLEKISQESAQNTACNIQGIALKKLN